ncbi:hypothetical protein K0651_08415 [Ornithinimicrobium sp. Arc0846-15]|nr:hypothetical protein [Ornithinimicrobium laminariae]
MSNTRLAQGIDFLRANYRVPNWLVAVVAAIAIVSVIDEFVRGSAVGGAAGLLAFFLLHASWPVVLRLPALGALIGLAGSFGAVLYIDRVGTAIMSAMIILAAGTALSRPAFSIATLTGFVGWTWWATNYFGEEAQVFWGQVLLFLLSAAIGTFIRVVVLELALTKRRLHREEERAEQARSDERTAIARDLHDIVAHELTLISLQSVSRRRSDDPQELQAVLRQVNETSRSALTELRALLGVLRSEGDVGTRHSLDATFTTLGLPGALETLVARVAAVGFDVKADYALTGWESLRLSTKQATFRIAQEALTNVSKHAPAGSRCDFAVKLDKEQITVLVESQITLARKRESLHPSLTSGQGIIGIGERASSLGGSATAGPVNDRWVVEAHLPA